MAKEVMIIIDGQQMPCPSSYTFGLQDVSAGESGRTDDAIMHKNRVAQKRKLQLEWVGKDWENQAEQMMLLCTRTELPRNAN